MEKNITGQWNGINFVVSSKMIMSWKELTIKRSTDTEDKKENTSSYVSLKNVKPDEITLSAMLMSSLGVDVRDTIDTANEKVGLTDYLYVGGKKVIPRKLMLTEFNAEEIETSASGTWLSANIKMIFKASTAGSGSSSNNGGNTDPTKKSTTAIHKKSPIGLGDIIKGDTKGTDSSSTNVKASDFILKTTAEAKVLTAGKSGNAVATKSKLVTMNR